MSDTTRMEITPEQYALIEDCLPRQRGNVSLSNLDVLNAILYVAEHGCKWRGLPKRFGNWHTIYTRMNRWTKAGVLDRVFEQLQANQIVRVKLEAVSLDSTRSFLSCRSWMRLPRSAVKSISFSSLMLGPGSDERSG